MSTPTLAPDYVIDADDLLAALARRNRAAQDLEEANRKTFEALRRLEAADSALTLVRNRLAERLGMGV